jgi:hypothetical protein
MVKNDRVQRSMLSRIRTPYVICEDHDLPQRINKPFAMVYPEFNGQLISHSVAIMPPSHLPPPLSSPGEMSAKITEERNSNYRLRSPHFTE